MNHAEQNTEAVFVNVMEVDPNRYDELMAIIQEGNGTVLRHRPGFISTILLASPDRSRIITIARWANADAIKPLQTDPLVADFVKRTGAIAKSASPGMFGLVAEYRP